MMLESADCEYNYTPSTISYEIIVEIFQPLSYLNVTNGQTDNLPRHLWCVASRSNKARNISYGNATVIHAVW